MDLPEECADFRVVVTVRNPYSRAVSLWHHKLREIRWNIYKDLPPKQRRKQPLPYEELDFDEYLEWVASGKATEFFSFTCCRWFKWVRKIDDVLKMEDIAALDDLGLGSREEPIPKLNKTTEGDWREVYAGQPEYVIAVWQWAKGDFYRFGYESESWKISECSSYPSSATEAKDSSGGPPK